MSAKFCALAFTRRCCAFSKHTVPFAGARVCQSWIRHQTCACRFANPTNLNGKSGWIFVNDPDNVQYISVANAKNYTTRYLPVRSCSDVNYLKGGVVFRIFINLQQMERESLVPRGNTIVNIEPCASRLFIVPLFSGDSLLRSLTSDTLSQ